MSLAGGPSWERSDKHWRARTSIKIVRSVIPTWTLTLLVAIAFFQLDPVEAILFLVEGLILATASVAVFLWVVGRHQMATIGAWVANAEGDPELVLRATRAFPARVVHPWSVALAFVLAALSNGWMVYQFLDGSLSVFAGLMVGNVGVLGANFLWVILAWESRVGPVIAETAPLATTFVRDGRFGISRRLTTTVAVSFWAGGFIVGAAVAVVRTESAPVLFAVAAVGSLMVSALLTSIYARRNVTSVLRPINQLIDATKRVAAGEYTQPVPIRSHDEFADLGDSFNLMQRGQRDREALHQAFASYVDPTLAKRLLDQGDASFPGDDILATVLFADVRDFTSYADRVTAKEAVYRLNLLFGIVVPILQAHGGHANKFLGDGLLAAFGAPEPLANHADAAVEAAIEIQRAVQDAFGNALAIGIGINTGRVIAGTVGAAGKLEYTLIGDPVNVAARLEQLTKETGDQILITGATKAALTRNDFLSSRGSLALRGKREGTEVFAVPVEPTPPIPQ